MVLLNKGCIRVAANLDSEIEEIQVPGVARHHVFVDNGHAYGRQAVGQDRQARAVVDVGHREARRRPLLPWRDKGVLLAVAIRGAALDIIDLLVRHGSLFDSDWRTVS